MTNFDEDEDSSKNERYVLRSPSIRNIQQNHVNNRIKDYFVNLQKSEEYSRSRPNLLLVDSSGSESSDEDGVDETPAAPPSSLPTTTTTTTTATLSDPTDEDDGEGGGGVHIYRGTVRSMIKRYGQVNFVFD